MAAHRRVKRSDRTTCESFCLKSLGRANEWDWRVKPQRAVGPPGVGLFVSICRWRSDLTNQRDSCELGVLNAPARGTQPAETRFEIMPYGEKKDIDCVIIGFDEINQFVIKSGAE